MLVRVVVRDDGGTSVIAPTAELFVIMNEATQRDRIARAYGADESLNGRVYVDVDDSDLPPLAERHRWVIADGRVVLRARFAAWVRRLRKMLATR